MTSWQQHGSLRNMDEGSLDNEEYEQAMWPEDATGSWSWVGAAEFNALTTCKGTVPGKGKAKRKA